MEILGPSSVPFRDLSNSELETIKGINYTISMAKKKPVVFLDCDVPGVVTQKIIDMLREKGWVMTVQTHKYYIKYTLE